MRIAKNCKIYKAEFGDNHVYLSPKYVSEKEIDDKKIILYYNLVEILKRRNNVITLNKGKIILRTHDKYDVIILFNKKASKAIGVYYKEIDMFDFNKTSLRCLKDLHLEIIKSLKNEL